MKKHFTFLDMGSWFSAGLLISSAIILNNLFSIFLTFWACWLVFIPLGIILFDDEDEDKLNTK